MSRGDVGFGRFGLPAVSASGGGNIEPGQLAWQMDSGASVDFRLARDLLISGTIQ